MVELRELNGGALRGSQGATSLWIPATLLAATLLIGACTGEQAADQSGTTTPRLELPADAGLVVLGDWGSGTEAQSAVATAMKAYAADSEVAAIVTTGDNLYSDEAAKLLEPLEWARDDGTPIIITWGNHDVESRRRVEIVEEHFGDPPRWALHDWGGIDLLVLDSTQVGSSVQETFLTSVLAGNDDPMVVVFHHAPYSCGSHGDSQEVLQSWVPAFDDDVVLVISGHEHNYQRFASGGIAYVVTGGGGAGLTDLATCGGDHPQRLAGESTHHFVTLESADELTVSAIDVEGAVIDRFVLPLP